jgi:hypothetical protein
LSNLWVNGQLETHPQNPNTAKSPIKSNIFVVRANGVFALKINDLQNYKTL